jgi:MSHA pilin protein MshA
MKTTHTGFTLIELIMVIAILGILAAFAMPRFADLGKDARISDVMVLQGSILSTANIAHSKQLAAGLGQNAAVDLEGASGVAMVNGYPAESAGGIDLALVRFDGFDNSGANNVFQRVDAPTPANCSVTYTEAASADSIPTVTVDTTGC